jgi:hypothetical protein
MPKGRPKTDESETRPLVPSFLDLGAVDFTLPCSTRSFPSPASTSASHNMHLRYGLGMAFCHLLSGCDGLKSSISLVLCPHICDG